MELANTSVSRALRMMVASSVMLVMVVSNVPTAVALEGSSEMPLTSSPALEYYPRAAIDSHDDIHLIYKISMNGNDQLWYRKVDSRGATLAGPTWLSPANTTGAFGNIAVAIDRNDRVHIVLDSRYDTDDTSDIFYTQLSRAGAVTVPLRRVYASPESSANPDIDVDGAGNPYIVWEEGNAIYWIRLSPTGTVSRPALKISEALGIGGSVSWPRIGVTVGGESWVVWLQKQTFVVRTGVEFARLNATGAFSLSAMEVRYIRTKDIGQLAVDIDKNFPQLHVAYTQGMPSQAGNELYIMTIEENGDFVDQQVQSTATGQIIMPDISLEWTGGAFHDRNVFITYAMRDDPPKGIWHTYLWVDWWENHTSESFLVGLADYPSTQPTVTTSKNLTAVIYLRNQDLYLVTFDHAPPVNNPPIASLSVRPADAQVGQSVTFDGSASTDPDVDDFVHEWNYQYGDGESSGWVGQSTLDHSYSAAGTYTASLRVRDTRGGESAMASVGVHITGGGTTNQAPVARLSATPDRTKVAQNIIFDGTSSTDEDGTVAQYRFDLGDGTIVGWTSTAQTTHSYAAAGNFVATLQVRDDDGEASENVASVTVGVEAVNYPPIAMLWAITPNPAVAGDAVAFTGEGTDEDGTIVAYAWGSNLDGPLSDNASFSTSTLSVGIHTITFKVRDDEGAWSDDAVATLQVKANVAPTLEVLTDVSPVDVGDEVEFIVRYTDPENDAPTMAQLHYALGGTETQLALVPGDPSDNNYRDGRIYILKVKMAKAGTCTFHFEFLNARNGRQVSDASALEVERASSPVPATGTMGVGMALLLVASVAARVTRRNRPQPRTTGQR